MGLIRHARRLWHINKVVVVGDNCLMNGTFCESEISKKFCLEKQFLEYIWQAKIVFHICKFVSKCYLLHPFKFLKMKTKLIFLAQWVIVFAHYSPIKAQNILNYRQIFETFCKIKITFDNPNHNPWTLFVYNCTFSRA